MTNPSIASTTSNVPIGMHQLNANGGNRLIEIFENLFSNSPGHVSHIGSSFDTGAGTNPLLPEPGTLTLIAVGLGFAALRRRKR